MKTRIAAVVFAAVVGVAAPISSAMAFTYTTTGERALRSAPSNGRAVRGLGVHDHPRFTACPHSSASEGNARQQNFPVKQYGQTSGGYRC